MAGSTLWANYQQVSLETASGDRPEGLSAICVGVGAGSLEDVARGMPYRGDWVRHSTVGELRRHGYEVHRLRDDAHPAHAVLLLKNQPSGADWEGWEILATLFEAPVANPNK